MSGTNDFLPFADIVGADVVSQAAWVALIGGALADGFVDGIADPLQCNKAWRQSSKIAAAVAGAMAALTNQNIVDTDGNTATLQAQFIAALQAASKAVILTAQTFDGAVVNGNAVRWNSGTTNWHQAIADGTSNDQAIGFADVTNGLVYLFGLFPALLSGLTPGARYYLSGASAGAITATAPADVIYVGIAKSATDLFVDFEVSPGQTSSSAIQKINASVGASALTCNYLGGTLDFRSATLGSGTVNTRTIAANSLTVPSGATLGSVNGIAVRLWLAEIDNGTSQELAIINTQLGSGKIASINESGLISTTALSGTSNTAGVWYSTTARSNVPFRLIGYIELTEATAGTWATAPAVIQGMGLGVYRPGQVIQETGGDSGATATGSGTIPDDDTIPQISEGNLFYTASVTGYGSMNVLDIEARIVYTNSSSNNTLGTALFQDAGANAIKAGRQSINGSGSLATMTVRYRNASGIAAGVATSITMRAGQSASDTTINGPSSGTRTWGGVLDTGIWIKEIMA